MADAEGEKRGVSEGVLVLDGKTFPEAVKNDPVVVVDFWAPWCMPCRMMAPVVEKLAEKMKDSVVFGKVNVDENQDLAGAYGILSIPTLLVFRNGEKVGEIVGALAEARLEERIRSFLG